MTYFLDSFLKSPHYRANQLQSSHVSEDGDTDYTMAIYSSVGEALIGYVLNGCRTTDQSCPQTNFSVELRTNS